MYKVSLPLILIGTTLQSVNPSEDDMEYAVCGLLGSDAINNGPRNPVFSSKYGLFVRIAISRHGWHCSVKELTDNKRIESASELTASPSTHEVSDLACIVFSRDIVWGSKSEFLT